jgi:predicted nucleic acid-binding Zn ribbon protein
MRRRQPRPIAFAVDRLTAAIQPATPLAEVQRAWSAAAGDEVARACAPVSERDGVVTVACGSAVWAQELALLSEVVCERLNEQLGRPLVTGLRVNAKPAR